jgi:hypothetical protein
MFFRRGEISLYVSEDEDSRDGLLHARWLTFRVRPAAARLKGVDAHVCMATASTAGIRASVAFIHNPYNDLMEHLWTIKDMIQCPFFKAPASQLDS